MSGNREAAIACVQDILAVAASRGSAYIYKRNDTYSEMDNVLAFLRDSEPVIHCKDCRNYSPCGECRYLDIFVGETDYCSFAERKDADATD